MTITVAIPTRDRDDYLAVLLTSLMCQDYPNWNLMLLYNGLEREGPDQLVQRLLDALDAMGHSTTIISLGDIGRSPCVAYNRAMAEASGVLLFLDDDMLLPSDYLRRMVEDYYVAENNHQQVVLSAPTPWLEAAWEGIGPNATSAITDTDKMISMSKEDGKLKLEAKQNVIYMGSPRWVPSDAISPANFMMRSTQKFPWSDCGMPMLYADLVWSMQLRHFGGYSLGFTTRTYAWHVNASSGGLREKPGDFDKTRWKRAQWRRVTRLYDELMEGEDGR